MNIDTMARAVGTNRGLAAAWGAAAMAGSAGVLLYERRQRIEAEGRPRGEGPGEGPTALAGPESAQEPSALVNTSVEYIATKLMTQHDANGDGKLTFAAPGQAADGNEALRVTEGSQPAPDGLDVMVRTKDTHTIYPLLAAADYADGIADNTVRREDLMAVVRQFDLRGADNQPRSDGELDAGENMAFESVFRPRLVQRDVLGYAGALIGRDAGAVRSADGPTPADLSPKLPTTGDSTTKGFTRVVRPGQPGPVPAPPGVVGPGLPGPVPAQPDKPSTSPAGAATKPHSLG